MGSAQSARGIQLGGTGTAARCGRISSRDLSPGLAWPSPGAFPPRRCAATGSGSAWKGSGRRWLAAPAASFTAPLARTSPLPGAVDIVLAAPSLPAGRDGAPRSRCDCRPGRTVLSAPQPRRAARAGTGSRKRRQGSAAMSATHPTRLETRTKESNARASQRVKQTPWRNESEGRRAPAEVGSRPRGARAHHRPVSPAPSGRWSVSACDRTRKMVNYAWAGRSQRKLWWRPVAVLTCKSVVRPGYRGERLIEPSSSWFPPKFPSG